LNSGIKRILLTILTQGVILLLSIITGFVLPQKMGPEAYGYWQVYLFYLVYLNIFGLGFNDGIALFYGGHDYNKLPFETIRSEMRIFVGYLIG
jgi:O-antigen/teichoic acid export membrane protein